MPDQWVKCTHPTLPDNEPILVPEISFTNSHSKRGWVLHVEDDVEDNIEPSHPRELTIITVAENDTIKAEASEETATRKAKAKK